MVLIAHSALDGPHEHVTVFLDSVIFQRMFCTSTVCQIKRISCCDVRTTEWGGVVGVHMNTRQPPPPPPLPEPLILTRVASNLKTSNSATDTNAHTPWKECKAACGGWRLVNIIDVISWAKLPTSLIIITMDLYNIWHCLKKKKKKPKRWEQLVKMYYGR